MIVAYEVDLLHDKIGKQRLAMNCARHPYPSPALARCMEINIGSSFGIVGQRSFKR